MNLFAFICLIITLMSFVITFVTFLPILGSLIHSLTKTTFIKLVINANHLFALLTIVFYILYRVTS